MNLRIENARVILPDEIANVAVEIAGGLISGLATSDADAVIDAQGMILAPAMVDIHGDAFERQVMPRPGVHFPLDAALLETDRQLAANGIATAYHALTLSWEPGLRSVKTGTEIVARLAALAPRLTVENRVQLRWETFCFEAEPLITAGLDSPLRPAIAFNDHTSMIARDPAVPIQDRLFEQHPDFAVRDLNDSSFLGTLDERAKRSQMSRADYAQLFRDMWERRPAVPEVIARIAAKGRAQQVPMLSHDDTQAETRDYFRALGAQIAEFPMNVATARHARERGDFIVFGAPNAARGGSHLGSPGAGEMVAAGLCDILASDYFYPAMLAAVARLTADGVAPLAEIWKLVSTNPAEALGLRDRGQIAVGQRADLVLIDWPEGGTPVIRRTLVAGRVAYLAGAMT